MPVRTVAARSLPRPPRLECIPALRWKLGNPKMVAEVARRIVMHARLAACMHRRVCGCGVDVDACLQEAPTFAIRCQHIPVPIAEGQDGGSVDATLCATHVLDAAERCLSSLLRGCREWIFSTPYFQARAPGHRLLVLTRASISRKGPCTCFSEQLG